MYRHDRRGVIPMFEPLFQITTDISVAGSVGSEPPALRRMTIEAPGHLSSQFGSRKLAEAAAERSAPTPSLPRLCYFPRCREILVECARTISANIELHQFHDPHRGKSTDAARVALAPIASAAASARFATTQTVMIGARRFDGHAAQKRVVQIRRFQATKYSVVIWNNVRTSNNAADDRGGNNAGCRWQALSNPIIGQSFAVGGKRLIGPIKPNMRDKIQIATPTPSPATSLLRRRTCSVR